jgi:hypothetical protein
MMRKRAMHPITRPTTGAAKPTARTAPTAPTPTPNNMDAAAMFRVSAVDEYE